MGELPSLRPSPFRSRTRCRGAICSKEPEAEGVAETDGALRHLSHEARVIDKRALADADEELVAGPVLPAVARRETEILADVVILRLQRELHVGIEIDHHVRGRQMDVDLARRQLDEIRLV